MALKRTRQPRTLAPHFPTWNEGQAATADDEYYADADGTKDALGIYEPSSMHWVIRKRNRATGEVLETIPCKTLTKSEVLDRVAQLNRGPTRNENVSWGRLRGRGRAVTRADKWFERLYDNPQTKAELQRYQASNDVLHREDLEALMRLVATRQLDLPPRDDEEARCKELDAVSFQLFSKLQIRRSGSEYQ
ncbi:MAG TPA: hypothetical protein VGG96_13345 [Steroidobacteraceae bacterium]|jgi:hypothetical protein